MPEQPPSPNPKIPLLRIEKVLQKIEHHLAPPPLWQRAIKFIFQHFLFIVSLLGLLYFTWKIWGYVSGIADQVGGIKIVIDSLKTMLSNQLENVKFW
jgi:hypothetical protein